MSRSTRKPTPPKLNLGENEKEKTNFQYSSPKLASQPKTYIDEDLVSFDLMTDLGKYLGDHLNNEAVKQVDPKTHELEFRLVDFDLNGRVNAFVSLLIFNRIIRHFQRKIGEYTQELSLDIVYDDVFRATMTSESLMTSKNNIQYFCLTNKLKNPLFMEKQAINRTDIKDWSVRISSSSEVRITDENQISQLTRKMEDRSVSKFYRYKNRYSFKLDEHFRLDLTIVKESKEKAGTIRGSGALESRERYQVELEYLGGDFRANKLPDLAATHLSELIKLYKNTIQPISKSHDDLIITEYLKTAIGIDKITRENLRTFQTHKFLAMEVEALTRENFNSIYENYMVTVKADGEHYLLFLHPEYGAYLINNRLQTTPVTINDDVQKMVKGQSIFDGELVEYQGRYRFLIFDCFFSDGKDVRDLPLFQKDSKKKDQSRIFYVNQFTEKITNELVSNHLVIEAKKYYPVSHVKRYFNGDNNWKFHEKEYPYLVDGLIFTPSNEEYPKITYRGGRFIKIGSMDDENISPILKWKPPEYMSVDFKVALTSTKPVLVKGKEYLIYTLESAYGSKVYPFEPSSYKVKGYNQLYLPLTEGKPKLTTHPQYRVEEESVGHIVKNKDVLECIWIPGQELGPDFWGYWFPIKYRDDKTQIGFPNSYEKVADKTWIAIQDKQITSTMLMKMEPSPQLDIGYYQKGLEDRRKIMPHLRDIHNALKSLLIHLAIRTTPNKQLMDLATGRGGDLGKWNGVRYVFGVEFDESNLKAGPSGAFSRYRKKIDGWYKIDRPPILKADLVQGNMSLLFDDPNFSREKVFNFITRNALRKSENFGIVSCQFALHYICDTEEHIDNFFQNVSRNLAPNGYFIATTFDGERVFNALKNSSDFNKDELPELTGTDNTGKVMWKISAVREMKKFENWGQRILVLNKTIKDEPEVEYLANFSYLLSVAEKYKLYPANLLYERKTLPIDGNFGEGSFNDLYGEEFLKLVKDTQIYTTQQYQRLTQSVERISNGAKRFSRFNSYLILKKQA